MAGDCELGQRSRDVEVRRMAERDGVNLACGDQSAQNFAHLAARGERSKEHLDLFHAGGDHGLQVDGGKHGDRGDLRGGSAFGDGLLEAGAQQLPFGGLPGSGDDRNDAQLLPELGDGAQNGDFSHFAAERMLELRDGGVAGLKLLVGLDGELRNLARTGQLRAAAPVAIAAQGIDIGQNPAATTKSGCSPG